jgi:type I restriction enzyme S subunit
MNSISNIDGWDHTNLKNLAAINYGKSPKGILSSFGDYPVVGTGGTERYGDEFIYDGESIIIGRKGTIDRIHFVSGRFWTIDTAYYLSDFNNALPRWLFYYLQNIDLRQLNEATGVPSLSRDLLYKIKVLKPPKPEQNKVAEVLSTVDRAIEQTEGLIVKQQRIKTGLMQDLLTRGIDKHGNLRSEETHEFKDSPLGRIPVEWNFAGLSNVAKKLITYGIVQPGSNLPDGVPFIQTKDLVKGELKIEEMDHTSKDIHSLYTRSAVESGDLIIGIRASVGLVCQVPPGVEQLNISRGVARLSPSNEIIRRYLYWTLQSQTIQNAITLETKGTTYPEITLPALRRIIVPIPPKKEQAYISNTLDSCLLTINGLDEICEKLKVLKTALMQDLLTGKVRVTPLLETKEITP